MTIEVALRQGDDELLKWWRAVMDALPFYVLLVDEDHRVVTWNRAMQHEFPQSDPLGAYCPEVVHGQSHPFEGCPLEDAVSQDGSVEKELYDPASARWIASSVYPTELRTPCNRRVYLHFARDITLEKQNQLALAQSLEHHKALGVLLQRLSGCKHPKEPLEHLIDTTLELSWMRAARGAAAFLVNGEQLELAYSRDLGTGVKENCAKVGLGHCVCGRGAAERKAIVPLRLTDAPGTDARAVQNCDETSPRHAAFPLLHEGKTIGLVHVYLAGDAYLEASQMEFLQAAIKVTTAALGEQLSRAAAREAEQKASMLEREMIELIIQSQEDERGRVARELHDDLGQALSALLLDIKTMSPNDDSQLSRICQRMDQGVRDLVSRVSALAWDLRPAVLDDLGLDSALSRHIRNVANRAQLAIDYRFVCADTVDSRLANSLEISLYRITQEALNNVVKHSNASHVSVLLYRQSDSVVLVVEDDGCGFDVAVPGKTSSGLGLVGMRERANLSGGSLVIESCRGLGTTIKVTLPLQREVNLRRAAGA
ncbi:MAG TPA: GAF domain-containing sensor histidine kinase [Polyangiaceae bacterium]